MKVFMVYNGFTGNDAVHCIVVAADEARARDLATESYKAEPQSKKDERYWNKLHVEFVCDCNKEFVGEIHD